MLLPPVKEDGSWRRNFRRSLLEQGSAYSQKIAIQKFIFRMLPSGKSGWLGGQSNMEFPVKNAVNGKLELSRCERSRGSLLSCAEKWRDACCLFPERTEKPLADAKSNQCCGMVCRGIPCRKGTFTEIGCRCWGHWLQLYWHFCQLLGTVCRPDRTHCLTSVLGSLPVRLPRKDRCRNGSGLRRISGISECMGKADDCLLSGKTQKLNGIRFWNAAVKTAIQVQWAPQSVASMPVI